MECIPDNSLVLISEFSVYFRTVFDRITDSVVCPDEEDSNDNDDGIDDDVETGLQMCRYDFLALSGLQTRIPHLSMCVL